MKIICPHCRHELNVSSAATGAELRCPVCRQEVGKAGFPTENSPHWGAPPRVERKEKSLPGAPDRRLGIPGWTWLILGSALIGLFAVPVAWYASRSSRRNEARREAEQVLQEAEKGLQEEHPEAPVGQEQCLADVLKNPFVDEATKLRVRRMMSQIARRHAALEAVALFDAGTSALQAEKLDAAKKQFEDYLRHPQAEPREATEARRLLDEIAQVNSPDGQKRKRLSNLSDDDLAGIRDGGPWPDGTLPLHPQLREMFIRAATPLLQQEWDKRRSPEKMFQVGQAVKNRGIGIRWRGTVQSVDGSAYGVRIDEVVGEDQSFQKGEMHIFDKTELQAEDPAPVP